jgi:two-component system sensor histidine kinase/response regulator
MKKKDQIAAPPSLNVLVAEDSRLNQTIAIRILKAQGHTVTVVSNGRQAVDALQDAVFDLILMDVDMPEMDGLDATRAIRALEATVGTRVPIVAVTANEDLRACLEAGMDATLSKPLHPKRLNQTLVSILGRTAA